MTEKHEEPLEPQWQKPDLDEDERGEIDLTAEQLGISQIELIRAFQRGELQELNDEDWRQMENCDSQNPTWTASQVHEHLRDTKNFTRIEDGLKNGGTIPAPVVLFRENHPPYLISGNSRLLGCRALGLKPIIFALRLESQNFAAAA